MNGTAPWQALLLAALCSACSASTPPAEVATDMPTHAATPEPPAPAPTPATAAPQAMPAPPPLADTAAESPPDTAVPARPPAAVKKPRPLTVEPKPPAMPPALSAAAAQDSAPVHATVTTLSRGKGVPTETRAALKRIRALLEAGQADSAVTDLQTQRIGLEGESRLCIEFGNAADAKPVLSEMHRIAAGIDLLDITETPCPYRKDKTP